MRKDLEQYYQSKQEIQMLMRSRIEVALQEVYAEYGVTLSGVSINMAEVTTMDDSLCKYMLASVNVYLPEPPQ